MPMTWNAEADAKLFEAVLVTTQCKVDNAAVAARMGPGCTAKAVSHRIAGIKKKAAEAGVVSTTTQAMPATTATPVTPAKRGTKTETNGNGSEADIEESPAKKTKTKAVATPRAKGKKKTEAPVPTTPATPGDLEDGGCKLEADSDGEY